MGSLLPRIREDRFFSFTRVLPSRLLLALRPPRVKSRFSSDFLKERKKSGCYEKALFYLYLYKGFVNDLTLPHPSKGMGIH